MGGLNARILELEGGAAIVALQYEVHNYREEVERLRQDKKDDYHEFEKLRQEKDSKAQEVGRLCNTECFVLPTVTLA